MDSTLGGGPGEGNIPAVKGRGSATRFFVIPSQEGLQFSHQSLSCEDGTGFEFRLDAGSGPV